MSTLVTVTVEDPSAARAEEAIGRAFDEMERVAALLNAVRGVVGRGLELHRRSGGASDSTAAPLVDLYQVHFTAHGGPPDLRALVGSEHVCLDERGLRLEREGMALTLDRAVPGRDRERLRARGHGHGGLATAVFALGP
jgi:thiamine biosynthesis lipoprotein ApbE